MLASASSLLALLACTAAPVDDASPRDDSARVADSAPLDSAPLDSAVPLPTGPRVIVLVLDGVGYDQAFSPDWSPEGGGAAAVGLPSLLDVLQQHGANASRALSTRSTVTVPAHVDLLAGAHDAVAMFPVVDEDRPQRVTLPNLAHEARRQLQLDPSQVLLVGNSTLITDAGGETLSPGWRPGYAPRFGVLDVPEAAPDAMALTEARALLEDPEVRLAIVNLNRADLLAHAEEGAELTEDLDGLDAELELLLTAVDALPEDTLLIITADHGRHSDELWAHHGDQCAGCRQIILGLVGAAVKPGTRLDGIVRLEDITATAAWWLGLEMPYLEGRVLSEALVSQPDAPPAVGALRVAALEGLVAEERLVIEDQRRSEIVVDGQRVSSEEAWLAEDPALGRVGEREVLCWRELPRESVEGLMAWTARCLERTGAGPWEDVSPPMGPVGSDWRPSIVEGPNDSVRLVHEHNPLDTHSYHPGTPFGLYVLHRGHDGHWMGLGDQLTDVTFPTHPAALPLAEDELLVAFGEGSSGERRVQVYGVAKGEMTMLWTPEHTLGVEDDDGRVWERFERPALGEHGGAAQLAALAFDEVDNAVLLASRGDEGWSEPTRVDRSGRVLAHVPPLFEGGELIWAELSEAETVRLCSVDLGALGEPACEDLGATALRSLGERVSLREPGGDWVSAPR